jgi:hypothetical protein
LPKNALAKSQIKEIAMTIAKLPAIFNDHPIWQNKPDPEQDESPVVSAVLSSRVNLTLTPDLVALAERYTAACYAHRKAARLVTVANSAWLKRALEHDRDDAWNTCQDAAEQLSDAFVEALRHVEVTP